MTQYTQDNIREVFAISDEAFRGLEAYYALLVKWQKAINLVSNNTLSEAWHRHFADSAQVARLIVHENKEECILHNASREEVGGLFDDKGGVLQYNKKVYADLGCGAGFPGLVIAMMRPELDVHLVESDERKGQFMRTVIREAGVKNATVHTQRIEDMTDEFTPDLVSARALASLSKLLGYCQPWIEANADLQFYFLKGERASEELEEARGAYDFSVKITPSVTEAQAQILLLSSVRMI